MTKLEFMKELESLLSDIPLEEREEALQYYNGYFEDAGENHEEEIIKELVSPVRVASIIKTDLNSNANDRESRGYFTENGYKETIYNEYEIVGAAKKESGNNHAGNTNGSNNAYGTNQTNNAYGTNGAYNANNTYNRNSAGQGQYYNQNTTQTSDKYAQQRTRNTNIALIVLVCIFGFPFILSALGIAFGIVMTIVGILFGFGVAGITMIGVGIVLFIAGLAQISVPFMGLLLCGSGLVVLGLGMLFMLICVMLCKNVLPALIKGIVNLCRKPFQNRSVTA
ncbi:MAG: DUF1700 domain-containing protein [Herbinix sp.]|nr:DUF1700 domain-containing protein [Herbinix sp.]